VLRPRFRYTFDGHFPSLFQVKSKSGQFPPSKTSGLDQIFIGFHLKEKSHPMNNSTRFNPARNGRLFHNVSPGARAASYRPTEDQPPAPLALDFDRRSEGTFLSFSLCVSSFFFFLYIFTLQSF